MTTIDFNALMQEAGEGFQPIPPGPYNVEVAKAEATTSSTQKPMIRAQLRVLGGPHNGRMLFDQYTITAGNPNALGFFFDTMAALGLDRAFFASNPPMEQVAQMLLGRQCSVTVGMKQYQGIDRNEVKNYRPLQGGAQQPMGAMPVMPGVPQMQQQQQQPGVPQMPQAQPQYAQPAAAVPTPPLPPSMPQMQPVEQAPAAPQQVPQEWQQAAQPQQQQQYAPQAQPGQDQFGAPAQQPQPEQQPQPSGPPPGFDPTQAQQVPAQPQQPAPMPQQPVAPPPGMVAPTPQVPGRSI